MGSFTPLIGTLRGKIGAIVIDKTGRTRLHAPGPNRTPAGVKNAFSVLAKSWPYSTVAYKSLVSDAPSVARGIGFLTGRAYRAYELAAKVADESQVDGAGIIPYRLSNLPGEFGENQQLSPFTIDISIAAGGVTCVATFTTLPVVQADSWQMAILTLSSAGLIAGTVSAEIAGADVVDATPATFTVTGVDDRIDSGGTAGMYVVFGAIIAADPITTLPVCHGFFSGAAEIST